MREGVEERQRERESERERERGEKGGGGAQQPAVSLDLHGFRHAAARAVAGVCSAHLLKHRRRHWYRRRHMEYTCTQSAQTQAHMHNALGAVASNRGGTACRRACLVHSCVCAPRSASKPRSQPTHRRAQALFIGRRRSCDRAARLGEANAHESGHQLFRGVRAVCGRSAFVTSGGGWAAKSALAASWCGRLENQALLENEIRPGLGRGTGG